MCGCGRTRPDQVTSVQAAQNEQEARAASEARAIADEQILTAAYQQSAANAVGNANSER